MESWVKIIWNANNCKKNRILLFNKIFLNKSVNKKKTKSRFSSRRQHSTFTRLDQTWAAAKLNFHGITSSCALVLPLHWINTEKNVNSASFPFSLPIQIVLLWISQVWTFLCVYFVFDSNLLLLPPEFTDSRKSTAAGVGKWVIKLEQQTSKRVRKRFGISTRHWRTGTNRAD